MNFERANFVFFLLTMLMYLFMFMGGNSMRRSRTNRKYWMAALLPILAFTLNMGLRWGRGPDYNNGYYAYERISSGIGNADDYEPLWRLTIGFFKNVLDAPWQLMVIFESFFLIYAFVFFLRNHKEIAHVALPVFAFLAFPSENLIRWFYSFSFILMGLYHLEKEKYWNYMVFAIFGGLTHFASALISLPFLVIFVLFKKRIMLSPWISIVVFILLFVFFKTTDMLIFSSLFSMVEVGGNFSQYQENIEDVLTNDYGDFSGGITGTSLILMPFLLWVGRKIANYRENLIPYYNIMSIGIMVMPALGQIQMTYRVALLFEIFQFVFLGYMVRDVIKRNSLRSRAYLLLSIIIILVFLRSMVVQPFTKEPDQTYYVWDANGRKTL